MNRTRLVVLGLVGAAVLSACGGGGGDAGSTTPTGTASPTPGTTTGTTPAPGTGAGTGTTAPPVTPGGTWLTLTPSPVSLTVNKGESVAFDITARSSRTIAQNVNVGIIDSAGVITTDVRLNARSQLEYVATLHTAPKQTPGAYTTNLEVRLCEDAPLTCKMPLPGSPWYVPLTVTVK
jgi:hypothetical protein